MAVNECDMADRDTEMPRRGDRVGVYFTGWYSHRGSSVGSSGCHIIEVGGRQCSVPPDAHMSVLERKPLEPASSVVVVEEATGRTWKNDPLSFHEVRWREITCDRRVKVRFTWQEILDETDGGLTVFRYQSFAECYKGPVRE